MGASGTNRGPVTDARDLGRVEHAVARIVAETEQPVEVYDAALKAIGEALGLAASARRGRSTRTTAACAACAPGTPASAGQRVRGPQRGAHAGARRGAARPRAGQRRAGVDRRRARRTRTSRARRRRGAAGCTPASASRCAPRAACVGVMEFFAGELREPDERLLATMDTLGSQIGQFVAGRRAAEEVRARESRLRAMLEAALDAVVTMDAARARDRLEPRRRGDLRLHRERGRRARDGRAHRPAAPARRPPPRPGALPARPSTAWSSTAGWS